MTNQPKTLNEDVSATITITEITEREVRANKLRALYTPTFVKN